MKHSSKCNLKLNPLKHYLGIAPLWLCYPDEEFARWYSNINWDSVTFAESLATAWDGIQP